MPHAYAFCFTSWAAESGVHASAMGVHPGTKRMPMYSPARWRARRSVPYAFCILPDTAISMSFVRFRRDFGSVHAACTPELAYTLACILYVADLHATIDSACLHLT